MKAVLILGLLLVSVACQNDSASELQGQRPAPRPATLKQKLAAASCVLAVEDELTVPSGRPTGNLLITLKDNVVSYVCTQELLQRAPGLQITSVMDVIGIVAAKGRETTAPIPADFFRKLKSVSCFTFVEEELETGLNGSSRKTGNFLAGMDDNTYSAACAETMYSQIPGARILGQIGQLFVIKGR
jgi:hypothetical protein